ncbi:putative DNA primase/helicase [Azomonas agilis]|uniref:Putative DNA primase/helicase n=2 Tax=Azomonas agilis TaxID=116849 RepID=A0A562HYY5_9GAMM|nr:putative DNA primase/helicase [Azomonas agilis]
MTNLKNPAPAGTGSLMPEKAEWAFKDALEAAFGRLDFVPMMDGHFHRFRVPEDKSGTRNGWYVGFLDNIASGAFGSWKLGQTGTWSSRKPTDPIEAELIQQRIEQVKAQRQAEQQYRHQQAAEKARGIWQRAVPAHPSHAYLVTKKVSAYGLRQRGNTLLVPLIHNGQLVNQQFIQPDGCKRFLSGGQVKGCYSPLGQIQTDKPLYLCEGWATGATLHQHTGCPVACAMNAGNLLPAGVHLKARYPNLELIVAGDDDRLTEGNPGRTKAIEAAASLGALVLFPDWPEGAPEHLTDFNDLLCWQKAQEVQP